MRIYFVVMIYLILLLAPYSASAELLFSLDQPIIDVTPGGSAGFMATLTNNGPDDLYLNSLSVTWATGGTGLTVDDSPFYSTPWPMIAGETWSDILFTVNTDPASDIGFNSAFLDIYGGDNASSTDPLGYVLFTVNIQQDTTVVPEPSSLIAVGFPVIMLGLNRLRTLRK
jgi:hypothetical protein